MGTDLKVRPYVRRCVGLVLLAITIFASGSLAAKCYPPETRVVVFVQGIYTYYNAGGTQGTGLENHRFDTLKAALGEQGYGDERLLDFSYNGGAMTSAGTWKPSAYACEDTDKPAAEHVATLENMLRAYKGKHPKAHFALVGHSLGGYIVFLAAARDAARAPDERIGISEVVTIDAPLLGVSPDKSTVIDFIPCDKTYQAGAELVAAKLDAATPGVRLYQSVTMQQNDVRMMNIGNVNDCLFNTAHCIGGGWVDDSRTQFVEAADVWVELALTTDLLDSHDAAVADESAIGEIGLFLGPP
jgi:pimeloyl-ACP methyl ester carboxylesterase